MKALIITDIQNDFLPGGSLEVPNSGPVVPVINRIQKYFDLVVATQDWHPQNHKSFASNHPGKRPFDKILLNGIEQILWPDHCVQGSEGAEFADNLRKNQIEAIVRKGTDPEIDSYSTFYDNAHRKSTGLVGYLKSKMVDELYFCGLAADFCVYYSIRDALREGFKCFLITDATYPINRSSYESIKAELIRDGVIFITSRDLFIDRSSAGVMNA